MNYDFNIKKIILACLVPAGTGDAVHKNRPSHGIALHMNGEKEYRFSDGRVLTVKANDIIYLPQNSTYTVSVKVPGDCYAINFEIDEDISFYPFVIKTKNHSSVLDSFRRAYNSWKLRKHNFMLKCKAELYNIIYTVTNEYISEYYPKNKLEIIQPAIDYIHENYTNEIISIELLAKMCNITPEYFRKIFKGFYGSSPVNYINNLKITRASELLESQMYSVSDVTHLSGFNEISHFSREFKKATGISPLKYKINAQK